MYEILQEYNPWWRDAGARRARAFPFRRQLQREVLSRIQHLSDRRATMILGPRQVGKTTLLRQVADDLLDAGWPSDAITYFDFSDHRLAETPAAHEVIAALPPRSDPSTPPVLLFDEIGLAPRWDRWLKQAVDEGGFRDEVGFRIAVTDSAASLLRRGSRESGQGRWDELRIEPLSFREFLQLSTRQAEPSAAQASMLIERYLLVGGFPEHARDAVDGPATLALERLRKDIVDRAILGDLRGPNVDTRQLRRLFVYLAEASGAEFNARQYAGRAEADVRSVNGWLALLEETLLVSELGRFAASAGKRARSHPKIYAVDPGIVTAFAHPSTADLGTRGRRFETAVYRHLRSLDRVDLSFARDKSGLEIDFVITHGAHRIAIEVTSSQSIRREKVARVKAAAAAFSLDRQILVHGSFERGVRDGVVLVPLPDFLLHPDSVLEAVP